MSKLIDADALIDNFGELTVELWLDSVEEAEIVSLIGNAPTIDAVEVVRCKDCKDIFFDDWYKCFSCANLYGLNEEVKPDDFCSHGERKESE